MTSTKPRAIIVGGGPIGLTAALGLTRAGIDYVVLESRQQIVADQGSDMVISPRTMNALEQLGIYEELTRVWNSVSMIERIDHAGRSMGDLHIFHYIRQASGRYPTALSRQGLMETMYRALPAAHREERLLVNKRLATIATSDSGVTVTCKDGTFYDGTFVIGADGVHSATRRNMRSLALAANSDEVNDLFPFLTTYQALWIRFPTETMPNADTIRGTATETHGPKLSTQLFPGQKSSTVGVYRRLPEPVRETVRYTEKDQDELVEEWADLPLLRNANVTLKDVYDNRMGSGLVSLEEGVVKHWSFQGKIVLVGDAAHKYTPSTGMGLNMGIADVVELVNELKALITKSEEMEEGGEKEKTQQRQWWDPTSLDSAFRAYQKRRFAQVEELCEQSRNMTATSTWATFTMQLLDQYLISSSLVQWFVGKQVQTKIRAAKTLAFEF